MKEEEEQVSLQEDVIQQKIRDAKIKAILTARQLWEMYVKEHRMLLLPELSTSGTPLDLLEMSKKAKASCALDLEVADEGLTFLAFRCNETLYLCGPGAIAAVLAHKWPPKIVSLIHSISFHFVVFDSICHLYGKIKEQFPNTEALTFDCTCLEKLQQVNALDQIKGLKALTIESQGNPILQLSLWRPFIIFRLGPSIELINGTVVTEVEREKADYLFKGLRSAASSLIPEYRLSSLLKSPRVKQMFLKEKGSKTSSCNLQKDEDSKVAAEAMKAALTYEPNMEYSFPRNKIKEILEKNLDSVEESFKKRIVFKKLWPSIFSEIVNEALEDYGDINRHMKQSMLSLLKKC